MSQIATVILIAPMRFQFEAIIQSPNVQFYCLEYHVFNNIHFPTHLFLFSFIADEVSTSTRKETLRILCEPVFLLLSSFKNYLLTELFLSYKFLHGHFKCIGYSNEGYKAGLGSNSNPHGNSSGILAEFVGQPLVFIGKYINNNCDKCITIQKPTRN